MRGRAGTFTPGNPLYAVVEEMTLAAAINDSRFAPVEEPELEYINIEISVLTPMVPLPVSSEADLIAKLRPGVDGVVFEADGHRSTFLPSVWEQLTKPEQFLSQLRLKAGLAADYWSSGVQCWTYQAIKIGEAGSD